MEINDPSPKMLVNSSLQTVLNQQRRGLNPVDATKRDKFFIAHSDLPTPTYRKNLNKVYNEEFTAKASSKELRPIIDLVLF